MIWWMECRLSRNWTTSLYQKTNRFKDLKTRSWWWKRINQTQTHRILLMWRWKNQKSSKQHNLPNQEQVLFLKLKNLQNKFKPEFNWRTITWTSLPSTSIASWEGCLIFGKRRKLLLSARKVKSLLIWTQEMGNWSLSDFPRAWEWLLKEL